MCTCLSKCQRSGTSNSTGSPRHQCSFVVLNHAYLPPLHELLSRLVIEERASDVIARRLSKSFTVPKHLPDGLAIGIKAVMFALCPSGFQFGAGDVPVRAVLLQHCAQVLP